MQVGRRDIERKPPNINNIMETCEIKQDQNDNNYSAPEKNNNANLLEPNKMVTYKDLKLL